MSTLKTVRNSTYRPAKHTAAFGAALATLAVGHGAPVEAAIVDLTPIFHSQGVPYSGVDTVGFGSVGSLLVWNTSDSKGISTRGIGITGLRETSSSNILTVNKSWRSFFGFGPAADGTYTFGFKTVSGQVGWFQVDLGGSEGTVHFLAGAFNDTEGGSIHVGTTPEPATTSLLGLGLLAMGAKGVRRLREQRKQQADSAAS